MARFTIAFSLLLAALVHAAPIMLNPPCLGEGCGLSQVKARHEGHDYPVADPPSGNTGASATGAPVPVSTPAAPNPAPSSPSSPSNPAPPPVPSTPSAPSTPSTPEEEECEEGEEEPEAPSVPAPTGSIPTQPETPAPTPPTDPGYPAQPEAPTGTDPETPGKPETPGPPPITPETPNAPSGGGFLRQNGEQAQKENTQFASLTKDSPCTDGDSACVEGAFGQCLGGKWVLQQCSNGLTCAALPLVNKQGTSVTCTTEADRDARITTALQG